MATIIVIQPSIMTEAVKRRLAAYCRVSSSSEDQLNSYQAQLTYYSHKFEDSTTEELVDLYADEGITGTREDKRDEFQRLMKDCRRGKIDRIYTKSISRFARNTKDCLKNLRELKSLGITVFFEKENIDTANMTDEIMITILGGLAQEESVSISQNMQWAIQKRMKNGTYIVSNQPYGYRKENGSFVVHEEEAMIVRRIYAEFLQGYGFESICRHLNDEGIIMSKSGGNVQVMDIHKEIAKLREQNHVIARLRTKGFMDEGKYQEQSKELNNKIRKLQAELKKLTRSDDEDDVLEQLDILIDYFEKREHMMVSFEPETFDSMVDKITANQNELTFHLLGGIELKEKI